jgi:hypothetical protein
MLRLTARSSVLAVLALVLSACGAEAPKTAPKGAEAPKTAEAPKAGGCDVTVTRGAPGPAVDLEEGKTYCVGEARLTVATTVEEAQKLLADCHPGEELRGETRIVCKGLQLSFAGPVLVLARIQPTAS